MCFHKWSKWELIDERRFKFVNGERVEFLVLKQMRKCEKCNKTQMERVD